MLVSQKLVLFHCSFFAACPWQSHG